MDVTVSSTNPTSPSSTKDPKSPPMTRQLSHSSRRSSDTHHRATSLHTVHGFTPEPVSPLAIHPQSASHRSSGLSASLASSSFHAPNLSNNDATNNFEFTHRVDAQSQPGATVLNFNRKTDDGLDMATSYRFFLVEEQMKKRQQQQQQQQEQQADTQTHPPVSAPTTSSNRSPVNSATSKIPDPVVTKQQPGVDTTEHKTPTSPTGKSSKKKVVTFDVKPAVVTITREVDSEKAQEAAENLGGQDLVFDLDDDDPAYASGESMPPFLREPVIAPRYSSRPATKSDNSGLSASYQAIRPSSLPAPSSLASYRPSPLRSQPEVPSPLSQPPAQPSLPDPKKVQEQQQPVSAEHVHDPRNLQILNLVAAHVPSHRGKWQPGSREWDAFVKHPDGREGEEEEVVYGVEPTFVGSLPVPIKPHRMPKEELSLASYQPKATLDGARGTSVPTISHRKTSSAAIRRATYAQRDLARSLDPGALDFAVEEDSDDTAEEEETSVDDRASRYARRILHARNSVPEAGMWRSLA